MLSGETRLAWAAANERASIRQATLTAFLLFSAPHLIYHLATTDKLATGDNVANISLLALTVIVPLALLAFPKRATAVAAFSGSEAVANGHMRLPGVQQSETGPLLRLVYWITRRRYGKLLDPLVMTAYHPGILRGYVAYELALERADRVEERLKDLAATQAATMVGCQFCIDIGSALLQKAGVSDEQLRELPSYRDSDAFTREEKLVLEYARVLTDTPVVVPDELFSELRRHFDEAQLVELTASITFENYRARFNHAFGIGSQGLSGGACQVLLQSTPASDTVVTSRKGALEGGNAALHDAAGRNRVG